jgi:hypothetical protein
MTDGIPEPSEGAYHIVKAPDWAECSECGGQVWVRVWGEGIDSEVGCADCDNKEIYR